jgi:hypothetical protein
VRQVLTNLIGNALKFTEQGEISVAVAPAPDGMVRLDVRDTGIGIPKDKLEHIFGEFNQVEDDRNRRYDGTGLGLAICRQLVTQMGGTITVTSTLGQGSCFAVTLPLDPAPNDVRLRPDLGIARAVVVGASASARTDLAAQLSALGLSCKLSAGRLDGLRASDVVFVLSEGGEAARPQTGGETPRAMVLVSDTPAEEGGAFDHYLTQPLSRGDLARTLNMLEPLDTPAPKPSRQVARLRVLAAEDNKTNQLVLQKMLKDADIDLVPVANGADAVARFKEQPPDMVFMDISMPGMDGREAARHIRAFEVDQGLPKTVIIAMTAHTMASDKAEIAAAGIDHHLAKPLNRASLLEHIERVRAARQASG